MIDALKIAADPNRSTIDSIGACREALNQMWWIEYCEDVK